MGTRHGPDRAHGSMGGFRLFFSVAVLCSVVCLGERVTDSTSNAMGSPPLPTLSQRIAGKSAAQGRPQHINIESGSHVKADTLPKAPKRAEDDVYATEHVAHSTFGTRAPSQVPSVQHQGARMATRRPGISDSPLHSDQDVDVESMGGEWLFTGSLRDQIRAAGMSEGAAMKINNGLRKGAAQFSFDSDELRQDEIETPRNLHPELKTTLLYDEDYTADHTSSAPGMLIGRARQFSAAEARGVQQHSEEESEELRELTDASLDFDEDSSDEIEEEEEKEVEVWSGLSLTDPRAAWHMPANVDVLDSTSDAEAGEVLVLMCRLDWSVYRLSPSIYPFFDDLVQASGCGAQSGPDASDDPHDKRGEAFYVSLSELERVWYGGSSVDGREYASPTVPATPATNGKDDTQGSASASPGLAPSTFAHDAAEYGHSACGHLFESQASGEGLLGPTNAGSQGVGSGNGTSGSFAAFLPPLWACAPSGIIFHQTRTGSTLVANMLGALNHTMILSEAQPPQAIVRARRLSFEAKVRWVRVIIAALARPIHAAARGMRLLADEASAGTGGWHPAAMYLKTQHTSVLWGDVYRAAFPATPWAFIHREPTAILMSMLRSKHAPNASDPGVDVDDHLPEFIPRSFNSSTPCLRSRTWIAPIPGFISQVARAHDPDYAVHAETSIPADGLSDNREDAAGAGAFAHPSPLLSSPTLQDYKLIGKAAVQQVHAESWCALDLAHVAAAAVRHALDARAQAVKRAAWLAGARVAMRSAGATGMSMAQIMASLPPIPPAFEYQGGAVPASPARLPRWATGEGSGQDVQGGAPASGSPVPAAAHHHGSFDPSIHDIAIPATAEAALAWATNSGGGGSVTMLDLGNPVSFAAVLHALAPTSMTTQHGQTVSAAFSTGTLGMQSTAANMHGSGSVLGVGLPLFLSYPELPGAVPRLLDSHFASPGRIAFTRLQAVQNASLRAAVPGGPTSYSDPTSIGRVPEYRWASSERAQGLGIATGPIVTATVQSHARMQLAAPGGTQVWEQQALAARPSLFRSYNVTAVAEAALWHAAMALHGTELERAFPSEEPSAHATTGGQDTAPAPVDEEREERMRDAREMVEQSTREALKLFIVAFMPSSGVDKHSTGSGSGSGSGTGSALASTFAWPVHISPTDMVLMASQSGQYSKARASSAELARRNAASANSTATGAGAGAAGAAAPAAVKERGPRLPYANVDADGKFTEDDSVKAQQAWPALLAAGHRYMLPLHRAMLGLNAHIGPKPVPVTTGPAAENATLHAIYAPRGDLSLHEALSLMGSRSYAVLRAHYGTNAAAGRGGVNAGSPHAPASATVAVAVEAGINTPAQPVRPEPPHAPAPAVTLVGSLSAGKVAGFAIHEPVPGPGPVSIPVPLSVPVAETVPVTVVSHDSLHVRSGLAHNAHAIPLQRGAAPDRSELPPDGHEISGTWVKMGINACVLACALAWLAARTFTRKRHSRTRAPPHSRTSPSAVSPRGTELAGGRGRGEDREGEGGLDSIEGQVRQVALEAQRQIEDSAHALGLKLQRGTAGVAATQASEPSGLRLRVPPRGHKHKQQGAVPVSAPGAGSQAVAVHGAGGSGSSDSTDNSGAVSGQMTQPESGQVAPRAHDEKGRHASSSGQSSAEGSDEGGNRGSCAACTGTGTSMHGYLSRAHESCNLRELCPNTNRATPYMAAAVAQSHPSESKMGPVPISLVQAVVASGRAGRGGAHTAAGVDLSSITGVQTPASTGLPLSEGSPTPAQHAQGRRR